jgi:hypothetical protein
LDLGERSRGTLRRGVAKLEIINSWGEVLWQRCSILW